MLISLPTIGPSPIYRFSLRHYKQLLDVVFVISGIIKVEVSVISRAEGRGYRISQKPNDLIIVLLYIALKKITINSPTQGT